MTGDDRLISRLTSWLEDQPASAPDQLLDSVLTDLQTVPQRAHWRSALRRFLMPGSNAMRVSALTVVALVAVIGVVLWARGGDWIGGPVVSPSPSPTPTATQSPAPTLSPSPSPVSSPVPLRAGPLAPGSYTYNGQRVRVTVTVPSGWEATSDWSLGKPPFELPDGVNLGFRQPSAVFIDPCKPEAGTELVGPTVDDLVTALVDVPYAYAESLGNATIGGFRGKRLAWILNPEAIDCVMALYQQGNFIRAAEAGQNQELWILDVAGTRLVIDGATFRETSADDRAELNHVVKTLVIEATQ